MAAREQLEAQPIPLEGSLSDPATLPRLYSFLSRGEWSGLVAVRAGDVERRVYFAEGRISTAGSNDSGDTLASHLIRAGLLTEEDRSKAAGQLRSTDRGWSFGRQLVKLGLVDEAALARCERRRVLAIAQATLGLRSGQYSCEAGAVAGDAMPNQAIEVPRVVAEGVLSTWDGGSALEVLGGRNAILDILPEHLSDYEATGAAEEYDMTLLRCNGKRSVDEILALSPLPEGVALRFLAGARLLACISSTPGAATEATEAAEATGYDPEATLPSEEAARAALQVTADASPAMSPSLADRSPAVAADPAEEPGSGANGPSPRAAAARASDVESSSVAAPASQPVAPPRSSKASGRWILVILALVILAGAGYIAFRGWAEMQASTGSP